jgi:heme exporter protein A
MSLSAATPLLARPPALLLQQLGQSRGGRPLFEGLDLALHAGDLLWVQGRNGAGKTSLLRLICGLSAPMAGRVHAAHELLYIAHKPGLKDHLTVLEQLRSSAALAGWPCSEAEALAALAPVGLADEAGQRQARLSEGQRRRAALAQLWLPQVPLLWVLDEPLAALDAAMGDRLAQRLDRHAGEGGCAVFTSHQALPLRRAVRSLSLGEH